jgi:hypothetical protein
MVSCTAGRYSVRAILRDDEISNAYGVVGEYVLEVEAGRPDPSHGVVEGWPAMDAPHAALEVVAGELPWTLQLSPRDAFGGRPTWQTLRSSFQCAASSLDGSMMAGTSCSVERVWNQKEDPAVVSASGGAVHSHFSSLKLRVHMTASSDSPVLLRFLLDGHDVVPGQLIHVLPGPAKISGTRWRWHALGLPTEPLSGLSYHSKLPTSVPEPYATSVEALQIRVHVADEFGNTRAPSANSSTGEASIVLKDLDTGLETEFGPAFEVRTSSSWYLSGSEYVLKLLSSDLHASRFLFTLRISMSPGKLDDAQRLVVSFRA